MPPPGVNEASFARKYLVFTAKPLKPRQRMAGTIRATPLVEEVLMDSGFYAACSGLIAKTRQLEAAAHNLANSGTTAFKAQQVSFRTVLAQSRAPLLAVNRALNEYGVASDPAPSFTQGSIERTGNDLDLAIEGPSYLALQTARGSAYSRNGNLRISTAGQLVTGDGSQVLGQQGPIEVPPGSKLTVSPDGTISANGVLVGKLQLIDFPADASLVETAPGQFVTTSVGVPSSSSVLRQGALEASNVNGVEAAVGLIAIQRHAEMLQRAMTIFHSEFNRIATGELSRV